MEAEKLVLMAASNSCFGVCDRKTAMTFTVDLSLTQGREGELNHQQTATISIGRHAILDTPERTGNSLTRNAHFIPDSNSHT